MVSAWLLGTHTPKQLPPILLIARWQSVSSTSSVSQVRPWEPEPLDRVRPRTRTRTPCLNAPTAPSRARARSRRRAGSPSSAARPVFPSFKASIPRQSTYGGHDTTRSTVPGPCHQPSPYRATNRATHRALVVPHTANRQLSCDTGTEPDRATGSVFHASASALADSRCRRCVAHVQRP